MFKSVIDFLEIGKDKTVHWFVRCQDLILGIFLIAGGSLMLCYGISILPTEHFSGGVVISISGLIAIILHVISRMRGTYGKFVPWIACANIAATILALLFTDDARLAGLLLVGFPLLTCFLFYFKRGSFFSIIMMAVFLGCGIFLDISLYLLAAFLIVSIIILMVIGGILAINEDVENASDHKISDIQKEAEFKDDFISQLSHQIRTPLNNIVVIGNLLNDTPLNQRQKDWMETILASANNLVNVVNLIASRMSSTGIIDAKPTNTTFNLQAVLNSVVQLFVGQSNDYNIGLKPTMSAAHILEGDPVQIKQIFLTLIDAIIRNKKVEKINIIISYRVRQETEQLFDVTFEIRVSDHLDFDLDDRENTEMLNYSISSRLIDISGGKLNMSHDNNFTTFNFTLSFHKAQEKLRETVAKAAEKIDTVETATSHDTSAVDLKEAKILLVEDNLINQKIVILSIQKMVKKIDVANNGQEALDKFTASKYDIILMDIQMPVMDGIQATKKIRELEIEKRIVPTPIIAITANALAGDREHCLASGMDEYISKPFQVEVLVSKMKNQLAISGSLRH